MFYLLSIVLFIWLLVKAIGLTLKLTWGAAKVIAGLLIGLALPVLFFCMIFVGGLMLLVPVVMMAVTVGIVKALV